MSYLSDLFAQDDARFHHLDNATKLLFLHLESRIGGRDGQSPVSREIAPSGPVVIKPTVGRVVLFHPHDDRSATFAALVAFVHSDSMVNLMVSNQNGVPFAVTSVKLVQDGETPPESGAYCEWMAYQKSVASGGAQPALHAQPIAQSAEWAASDPDVQRAASNQQDAGEGSLADIDRDPASDHNNE